MFFMGYTSSVYSVVKGGDGRGRFLSGRGEDFIVAEDLPRKAKKRKIQICKKGG